MKKNSVFFLLLLLVGQIVFAQTINIKIANIAPERSPWDIELKKLAQEWSTITNGKVRLSFINASTLGDETGVIKKLKSVRPGQKSPLQGGVFSPPGIYSIAPKSKIYTTCVPFLIRNQKELDLVLDKFGNEMIVEIRKEGYEVIAWSNVGWLSFYTKATTNSLADLKKLKLGTGGLDTDVLNTAFSKVGFRTTPVNSDKTNQSLQSSDGIKGIYSVPMYAYAMGYYKNISDALDAKICPVMAAFLISSDTWAKVPETYKPAMLEAVQRMVVRLNESLEISDREYISKMQAEGVRMNKLSDEDMERWAQDFEPDVNIILSSMDVFDKTLLRSIQSYLKTIRK